MACYSGKALLLTGGDVPLHIQPVNIHGAVFLLTLIVMASYY
jgi:hypothetical protein